MASVFLLQLPPFIGGLNTTADPTRVKPTQAHELLNADIVGEEVRKRAGTVKYGPEISSTGRTLGLAKLETSSVSDLITGHDTSWYKITSTGKTAIKTGLTADKQFESAMYLNKLYIVNGAEYPHVYDGSTCTSMGDVLSDGSKPSFIALGKDRIFFATSTRVYWMEVGDPTVLDGNTGDGAFGENDGDVITGIKWFDDRLYVFKNRSTYNILFDSTGVAAIENPSKTIGSISQRTIQEVGNNLIFLSEDGVRTFGQPKDFPTVEHSQDISGDIRTGIILYIGSGTKAEAWYFPELGRYMLSCGFSSTQNDMIACYYAEGEQLPWTLWSGLKAACFIEYDGDLFYGSDEKGQLYKMEQTTYADDGAAIDFRMTFKRNANAQGQRVVPGNKMFKALRIEAKLGLDDNLDMSATTDIQTIPASTGSVTINASYTGTASDPLGQAVMGMSVLGGGVSEPFERVIYTNRRIPIGKSGKYVEIELSNNDVGEEVSIIGLVLEIYNKSKQYLRQ